MRLTLPETHRSQVQYIQESPKFYQDPERGLQPNPFPGYAVITPPAQDETINPVNQGLYTALHEVQQQLVDSLGQMAFAAVPLDSFHLTLADLLWDGAYRHASEQPGFEAQLQRQIAEIFADCRFLSEGRPVQFQAVGLMIMPRAVAMCLVPVEEAAYDRVLKLRRALYQNQDLMGLGIEQQYYFTPHITLGYFGAVPEVERAALGETFVTLNQQWLDREPQIMQVLRAELRKFDNMTRYYRAADWPVLQF